MAEQQSRRRTFWPIVLLGVAGSGLAAIAGGKDWFRDATATPDPFNNVALKAAPAVTGLALVALAAWGVVLVTRGRVRRAVVVLGALFSAAAVAASIGERATLGGGAGHWTAWPWIALVASLAALAASVLAFLWAPQWPEMGRRYDAPTTGPALPEDLDEAENIDLWKSISEGHDPTSDPTE